MADSGQKRPVFFNPLQIQWPVGALTSIAHRVTGVLLALAIPFGIYLLDVSLQNAQGYARVSGWFESFAFRVAAVLSTWTLAHHVLAGIRHLLSDVDIGSQLPAARGSAWVVNSGGIAVALLAAGILL